MTSTIKVNTIQNTCGADIIKESGNTITIGASGDTVTLGSGASQSGFGRTGTVDWQTGSIKTANFTAVNGQGFFVNTTSSAITVTLPSSPSAGNIVAVADYAGTSETNAITIDRNGSPFEGGTRNGSINTNRQTVTLVYVDATQGWVAVNSNDSSFIAPGFVAASGGNTTVTCGNFKVHTFTGPGTFTVSCAGNELGSNTVDYLVVAGGGGGAGRDVSGGGGGGGFRLSNSAGCIPSSVMSPLANATGVPVTATAFPITVGGGGAGNVCQGVGTNGSTSTFSTISSAGGGGGGVFSCGAGSNGGSGGGGGRQGTGGGSGNTPPVNPPQGFDGGDGSPNGGNADGGGGGGGAGAVGFNGQPGGPGGGGDGSFISPAMGASNGTTGPVSSTRYFSGGGGGSQHRNQPNPTVGPGPGGAGGGGSSGGASGSDGVAGSTNTGGGGGASRGAPATGGSGGSGIVIIRYKFQ